MMEYQRALPKKWMKGILFIAAVISLASGIQYVAFPELIFRLGNLESPDYLFMWQTLGGLDIIFALSLFIAAFNPHRHWATIFLILSAKIVSSSLFIIYALQNPNLWNLSNYIFMDNLIWIVPLGAVLYGVYKKSCSTDDLLIDLYSGGFSDFSLDLFETNTGANLKEMSEEQPIMLVFLRHFGCTFCRESMQDIFDQKKEIENKGTKVVVVHMLENEEEAFHEMEKFGIEELPAISDPESILYKMFKLRSGSLLQLFGPKVIFRGLYAAIVKGLGLGAEKGNMKQMPGVFLIHKGKIKKQFIHKSAADRPNYMELATFE